MFTSSSILSVRLFWPLLERVFSSLWKLITSSTRRRWSFCPISPSSQDPEIVVLQNFVDQRRRKVIMGQATSDCGGHCTHPILNTSHMLGWVLDSVRMVGHPSAVDEKSANRRSGSTSARRRRPGSLPIIGINGHFRRRALVISDQVHCGVETLNLVRVSVKETGRPHCP
jgi:hypothetical protein